MNIQENIQEPKGNEANRLLPDGWIKVSERKPIGKPVLVCFEPYMISGDMTVSFYVDGEWFLFHSSTNDEPIKPPTHWMDLPNLPTIG